MVEPNPKSLSRDSQQTWISDSQIEAFLARIDSARPLNIVGGSAALADRIASFRPDIQLRVISSPPPSGEAAPDRQGTADLHHTAPDHIPELLLPKSRTLILDPFLATELLGDRDFWRELGLKTFEWVLAPLMAQPANFTLFSDDFSFVEPLFNDASRQWCWSLTTRGVVWVVTASETATFLSFTLTGGLPGTFEVQFGNAVLRERVDQANRTVCFRLPCRLLPGANSFRIGFDGAPFSPGAADERDSLTFCIADIELASAPNSTEAARDRAARRLLHSCGFFEIQTVALPGTPLSHLDGLRSCFDYREGFRFRDYRRFSRENTAPDANPSFPAVWYCLRKTPTPGSEWAEPSLPCAENPIVLDWSIKASEAAHADRDIVAAQRLLEERDVALHRAAQDLLLRDAELVQLRDLLAERTAALDRAAQDLLLRDAELVQLRDLLAERTAALDRAARDLLVRDAELQEIRTLLVDRTSALEAALSGVVEHIEVARVTETERR